MASAMDKQTAAARPSAVAAADRLPKATRGSQSSYTTSGDITSKSQVSRLCAEIDERVGAFKANLERPIVGRWPYLWLDATYLKVRRAGRIVPVAATVAVAVNTEGRRDMVAAAIRTAFIQEDRRLPVADSLRLGHGQWRQVHSGLGARQQAPRRFFPNEAAVTRSRRPAPSGRETLPGPLTIAPDVPAKTDVKPTLMTNPSPL